MKKIKEELQPKNQLFFIISICVVIVMGLGVMSMGEFYGSGIHSITGNSVREIGKAPTTPEALESCNILYQDYFDYCSATFDEESSLGDCLIDAKQDCYNCVYNTKNPTTVQLQKYCYK